MKKETKFTSKINIHNLSRSQKSLLKVLMERKQSNDKKKYISEIKEQSTNPTLVIYNPINKNAVEFGKDNKGMVLPVFIAKNVVVIVRNGYDKGITAIEAIDDALVYIKNSLWYDLLSSKQQNYINASLVRGVVLDSVKATKES